MSLLNLHGSLLREGEAWAELSFDTSQSRLVKVHVPHRGHLGILPVHKRIQHHKPHPQQPSTSHRLPHYHVGHFICRPELLIIHSNDRDDPGNVLNEFFVGSMKIPQVFQRYGWLALSLSHLYPSLALLRANVKVNYQVRLFPINITSANKLLVILYTCIYIISNL